MPQALLPQPRPDFVRTAAMDEDVFVGFKNTLAELTVCFVTQTDVFMEVVCPGVETPMAQDLGKELKFGGETDVPNSHCIDMVGPLGSEQLVSTP